ncbi:AAA family ATPase [Natronorubrum sp. FCH18a]|uniref:AAA family ATPase n=1 Tax=Natronorubrum sp. FCH18a TaxID=3447018 RepID=UPI003F515BE4
MTNTSEEYKSWSAALSHVQSHIEIEDPDENWLSDLVDPSDLSRWEPSLVPLNNPSAQYNHIQVRHGEEIFSVYAELEQKLSQKAEDWAIRRKDKISPPQVLFAALMRGLQDNHDTGGKMNQVKMEILEKGDLTRRAPNSFFIIETTNESPEETDNQVVFDLEEPGAEKLREATNEAEVLFSDEGELYAIARIGEIAVPNSANSESRKGRYDLHSHMQLSKPILESDVSELIESEWPVNQGIFEITEDDFQNLITQIPEVNSEESQIDSFETAFRKATEPDRTDIYNQAIAHLVAGRNVVFYGPPGSGKTRIAARLTDAFCARTRLETANAEWTRYDIIGGPAPKNDGSGFKDKAGLFTKAAAECATALDESGQPVWLIIDELNRANLDQAFGEVFTQLDLAYRNPENTLPINDVVVPLAFRLLATMNTSDQAQLFSLGYAFRRRFAFVHVPSLLQPDAQTSSSTPDSPDFGEFSLDMGSFDNARIREIIADGLANHYDQPSHEPGDTPLGLPQLEKLLKSNEAYPSTPSIDHALTHESLQDGAVDFLDVLIYVSWKAGDLGLVDIGQGLIIDAAKFVVARTTIDDNPSWEIVDDAIRSYLLPQFDSLMPELRKSEVTAQNDDIESSLDTFIDELRQLQVRNSVKVLERAKTTKRVI